MLWRDRVALHHLAIGPFGTAAFEGEQLHGDKVDDGGKGVIAILGGAGTHGKADGDRTALKPLANLIQRLGEVGANDVHFVDEDQAWHAILVGLTPDRLALSLDAFLGVKDHNGAVQDAQRAFHLGSEIDVAGRVDEITRQAAPLERDAGRLDGNALLPFQFHPIGLGGALIDATKAVDGPGIIEHMLGGGRLAGINMGDHANVAELGEIRFGCGRHVVGFGPA